MKKDIVMVLMSIFVYSLGFYLMLSTSQAEMYDKYCATTDVEKWNTCYQSKNGKSILELASERR